MSTTTITILTISGVVFYLFIGTLICAIRRTYSKNWFHREDEIGIVPLWPFYLMFLVISFFYNLAVDFLEEVVRSIAKKDLQKIAVQKATEINKKAV